MMKASKATIRKRHCLIETLDIFQSERQLSFEIKLPAGVKKITGVAVTMSIKQLGG